MSSFKDTLIHNGHGHLANVGNRPAPQLDSPRVLVDGFQKPGTKRPVDLDGRTYHSPRSVLPVKLHNCSQAPFAPSGVPGFPRHTSDRKTIRPPLKPPWTPMAAPITRPVRSSR